MLKEETEIMFFETLGWKKKQNLKKYIHANNWLLYWMMFINSLAQY